MDAESLPALGLGFASATFHGRDVMGPLGAELALRHVRPEQLGERTAVLPGRLHPAVRAEGGALEGQVAVIDHFGNALTTISAEALAALRGAQVLLGTRRLRLVRTYAEARADECVALLNSSGMLELAAREASAAARLRLEVGALVHVVMEDS